MSNFSKISLVGHFQTQHRTLDVCALCPYTTVVCEQCLIIKSISKKPHSMAA